MRQHVMINALWAAALVGEGALAAVLLYKKRWRDFPAFTALIIFPAVSTLFLFPLSRSSAHAWYARLYWGHFFLNVAIQLAVVVELARFVLRPTGSWVRDARKQFTLWGAIGAVVALGFAYTVSPQERTALARFSVRADLFTSMLVCELFLAMASASTRLGLGWRNHVMAVGQGITAWSLTAVIVNSIYSYFGVARFLGFGDYLRDFVYLGALCYWCVQLWRDEPPRQPISPELLKYILALHRRVNYDLGEAER